MIAEDSRFRARPSTSGQTYLSRMSLHICTRAGALTEAEKSLKTVVPWRRRELLTSLSCLSVPEALLQVHCPREAAAAPYAA